MTANRGNYGEDSTIGLNVGSSLSDRIDIAAQFIAGGASASTSTVGKSNWDFNANWAFVSFKVLDNLKLKYGRQLLPNWLAAEYEFVTYLQPYRKIPEQLRSVSYFYNFNGLRAEYIIPVKKGDLSLSTWAGDLDLEVSLSGSNFKSTFSNIYGASATFSYDGWKFHSQYNSFDVDFVSYTTNTNIASANKMQQYNFGLAFEKYNFVVWSEYGKAFAKNQASFGGAGGIFEDSEAFYTLLGYKMGDWMPRLMYTRANALKFGFPTAEGKETVVTLGANYQFHPKAILKVDLDKIIFEDGHNGVVYRKTSRSTRSNGEVLHVSIDFIF